MPYLSLRQLAITWVFGLSLALGPAAIAHADEPDVGALVAEASEAYGVNANAMLRVATCESGLNPNAVGDHGTSFGTYQLHRGGMLPVFYAWGYDDPFQADQSVDFVARWIALTGNWRPWTCARNLGIR